MKIREEAPIGPINVVPHPSEWMLEKIELDRRQRLAQGIAEYRQDPEGPFVGDPLTHGYEECLDGMNYAEEAERCGKMELWEARTAVWLLHQSALLFLRRMKGTD